ncbi:12245_t:CDS:2 [Racocetra fulgida]|uniref:12245_t:CDS:1 n=1 Tax=Racocetra fulgida TaxID=60492 RepID=A0A9N9NDH1_9GLOM|nr:12245_t:CDS:2 [Racocetra fulgida]
MQHDPISLCIKSSNVNGYISTNHSFNLEYLMQLQGGELYTSALQNINNTRSKYGYAYGLIKRTIEVAINTNLYDELIGLPPDRAKSVIEIQESNTRKC